MALTSESTTIWKGTLFEGSGNVSLDSSGLADFQVTWDGRSEGVANMTNPEELLAAAHSSCFSMALSLGLSKAGSPPQALDTQADVSFQPGEGITGVHLTVVGSVEGMDADTFQKHAEDAKANCPVSQALTGTTITLDASLA